MRGCVSLKTISSREYYPAFSFSFPSALSHKMTLDLFQSRISNLNNIFTRQKVLDRRVSYSVFAYCLVFMGSLFCCYFFTISDSQYLQRMSGILLLSVVILNFTLTIPMYFYVINSPKRMENALLETLRKFNKYDETIGLYWKLKKQESIFQNQSFVVDIYYWPSNVPSS